MRQRRRASSVLRLSRSGFAVGEGEGKENTNGGEGRFKMAAGEFTFEVSNPNVSGDKNGLGLREGSSGSINALVIPLQKDGQRLSLAWKPAEGGASRNGTPSRGNLSRVDSPGLYDRQGFLISASPVRGVSPSRLRV
jgi:hypothetical protein